MGAEATALLHVTVTLGGHVYTADLNAQAAVMQDLAGLNKGLVEQTAQYAWWSMLETHALSAVDESKEKVVAFESEFIRVDGAATTAAINNARTRAKLHPTHTAIRRELRLATATLRTIRAGLKTMKERREVMIELSRNIRGEMEGRLRPIPVAEQARSAAHALSGGMPRR